MMSQQLLTALLFGAVAGAFALIWNRNRHLSSAGFYSLAYLAAGLGFLFDHLFLNMKSLEFLTPVGDTFYLAGPLLLTIGLARFYARAVPDLALALIFMATFLQAYWFWFVEDQFVLRTEIISYACAAMIMIGAYIVYSRRSSLFDQVLFFAVFVFSVQFVLVTFTSIYLTPATHTATAFLESSYIKLLHFSAAATAIFTALLLFVGLFAKVAAGRSAKRPGGSVSGMDQHMIG